MGRKRKGVPIHGWLIIDKPLEVSSSNVVGKVKWLTKAQKVGHGGTLDPLASGILPIALGEATKTTAWAMDGTKVYRFMVRWGQESTTDDAEGEVTQTSDARPSQEAILAALTDFIGEIDQMPPIYSALKVDGKRAYALARDNQEVELASRRVTIHDLKWIESPDADHALFDVICGKGTYVRAIARDLGRKLGCLGRVETLRRTKVANFGESQAISLEKLEALVHSAALSEALLPVETVLDDIPALALTDEETRLIKHGRTLSLDALADRLPRSDLTEDVTLRAMHGDRMIALTRIEHGELKPFRVLNID